MPKAEHAQQLMEETLRANAQFVREQFPGTINEELGPHFVSCDAEKGEYVCAFEITPRHKNPGGMLHGGVISMVLDTAMGHLAHYYVGHMTPTITLNISYLRPSAIDRALYVRCKMDKPGSTVCYLSAEAYNADAPDKILVTASGAYLSTMK